MTTTSMAATFPLYWNPRMGSRPSRNRPFPVKMTKSARYLAHRGAMAPEGVTADNIQRARCNHRLGREQLKDICKTLWAFRLLWWKPSDTLYLDYEQVEKFVSEGKRRPLDTLDVIPDWFARRYSVEELKSYREGKE